MPRLTNADLYNDIQLLKQDVEYMKEGQAKMQADLTMIKKTFPLLNQLNWKNYKNNFNDSFNNKQTKLNKNLNRLKESKFTC